MPSKYVSASRGTKRSASVRSEQVRSNFESSPQTSRLGPDKRILDATNDVVVGKENCSTSKASTIEEFAKELEAYGDSEHCDVSQMMDCDLRRSFDYTELCEEKLETSTSDFIDEEIQWHEQSLVNRPLTGEFLNDLTIPSVESQRKRSLFSEEAKTEEITAESLEKPERQLSSASDDFIFDDLALQLGEQDEFSILQRMDERRDSSDIEVRREMCNKNLRELKSSSFYGLPEKVKTLIEKTKKITSLYDWQDECLNLKSVKNRKNLIYALPTSGGKTLVAEILMLKEMLCNKKNVLFVLPFVAIVQEKVQSMTQFALELGFLVEEYAGGKGQYPPVKRRRKNSLYVCTIEKAQGLINSLIELQRLDEIGTVVVDELHLLGEDGGRGATLEGLLTKLMCASKKLHIVGMSATIGNLDEVARFLNADIYIRNFRPVEIKEYVKCENQIWLLNLREDPIFTDPKKINYRYSEAADRLDPDRIGGLVMDVVPHDSCLVFCSSRKNCENVALLLTRVLFKSVTEHKVEEKELLLRALRVEGEVCPILSKTIKFGVAYHHSGLTSEERRLLEEAFRESVLCVICCTSTLAAGVNLPARRVILRSPYVGNQFLNLSRYKQMIGRAGRAGMGEIGESILICKNSEIPRTRELLTSRMDDCLSTLHLEEDRGINNLILSSIMLSIAATRSDLHKLTAMTLLGVQEKRLNVSVKDITDKSIANLLKAGVLRVKRSGDFDPNVTVGILSQFTDNESKIKKGKRTIVLTASTVLDLSPLGRAAMKDYEISTSKFNDLVRWCEIPAPLPNALLRPQSTEEKEFSFHGESADAGKTIFVLLGGSVDLQCAHTLYQDLKTAQRHLVLINDLHVMYLVTPYDLAKQMKPVGSVFYNVITSMPASHMDTPRVLGITEATVAKLRDGIIPKTVDPRVINRFWLTLILYELWQHRPLYIVAEKYQVNRGVIQNLLNAAATFANSVVRFCQELQEFWAFTDILTTFSRKLRYCCAADLEPLMELPAVKVGRARQLYNAGYRTLQSIAAAKPDDLAEKIKHLPKKTIKQIIAAANLLLMERVENLRDEAAEMLEGLDTSNFV